LCGPPGGPSSDNRTLVEPGGARLRHPLSAWNLDEMRLAPYAPAVTHLAGYQTTRTAFPDPADDHDREQSSTAEAV